MSFSTVPCHEGTDFHFSQHRPLSELTREALRERVERLQKEKLARELEEGYRAEAKELSLDPEWQDVEVEGL